MKKILTVLKYVLFLGIGILLLWLVYRNIDISNLKKGFSSANYLWVILGLTAAMFGHVSRGRRWAILIEPLGKKVKTSRAFIAVMFGYLANIAVPRMGEISRCVALNRTEKLPLNKLIGTVIVERGFDFIVLMFILIVSILLEFNRVKVYLYKSLDYFQTKFSGLFSLTTLIVFIVIVAGLVILLIMIKKSKRGFKQHTLYLKIREILLGFWSGIKTIKTMEHKWEFVFHTFVIWFSYYLMTYFIFFATEPTSHLGPLAGFLVLTIGSIGFILPVQGGIGTYHYAAQKALEIYGVEPSDGAIYALIAHSSQTLLLIIAGAISFFIIGYIQRKVGVNESLSKN